MWIISKQSIKCLVSHLIIWQTSPARRHTSTAISGGGVPGSAFSFLSWFGRSTTVDLSSRSGSGYFAGLLTSIHRNVSRRRWEIGESRQVLSAHSSDHYQETSFQSSVSPNTNKKHATHHQWTLHAPEAPHHAYLSTRVFSFAWESSLHSRLMTYAIFFSIQKSCIPLASTDSDHFLIVQTLQSASSGTRHRAERLRLRTRKHASISSLRNTILVHSAILSQYHPLDRQADLDKATLSDNTSHRVNGIPLYLWCEVSI